MNEDDDYDDEYLRQTFVNIGIQCASMCNDPHAIMALVLVELVELHGYRVEFYLCIHLCSDSDLFSLSSDETYEPEFKYYISSDEENLDFDPEFI